MYSMFRNPYRIQVLIEKVNFLLFHLKGFQREIRESLQRITSTGSSVEDIDKLRKLSMFLPLFFATFNYSCSGGARVKVSAVSACGVEKFTF